MQQVHRFGKQVGFVICGVLAVALAGCSGSSGDDTQDNGDGDPQPEPFETQTQFANWENAPIHPIDLSADGATLCVCNLPDGRLEVFDVSGDLPVLVASIPVGIDPVSVRLRTAGEAWVVNHISDSVSVVDIVERRVVRTLQTADEPCDVVFAGDPLRAFVSCSQANMLQRFDPADLDAAPVDIPIAAEDPRALAVSEDGGTVYAAVFESGNATTILGGGIDDSGTLAGDGFPPNVVSDGDGPHGGANPPENTTGGFTPGLNTDNPTPPPVGLIVKHNSDGKWVDDTGADWTEFVSGGLASRSGRVSGWTLLDRDLAVVDTDTLDVEYRGGCMNLCMALTVRPGGDVWLVGTDATNDVRFEPNLRGRFLRVNAAALTDGNGDAAVFDLNPHLAYDGDGNVPVGTRVQAIGDPRGIVWHPSGDRGFVTGMGSNNLVSIAPDGTRNARLALGAGPTGLAIDGVRDRLYVLNRFDASVSVVDVSGGMDEVARVPFFDPTPDAIRAGRPHLYNTHDTSGLGHASCASCHVDARTDRLSWDLGDPSGEMKSVDEQNCLTDVLVACEDFHPMKGPMFTQTLQDIIGKEPFHWRGDRDGLEEFDGAFSSLLGDDTALVPAKMQEFENFLATVRFPPNPFRSVENGLPANLPLPGHFTTGRFGASGQPLPDGDAQRGLLIYRTADLDGSLQGLGGLQCVTCHTLPAGIGPDLQLDGALIEEIPPGPNGERHHSLVSVDGSTNVSMKVPQLRSLYEKVGFEMTQTESLAGFGFLHDGSIDSLARFVSEPVFEVESVQDISDLVAFLLAFSGSDLPDGSLGDLNELPGPASRDTHAAVGMQQTLPSGSVAMLDRLQALAVSGEIDLVAHGVRDGENRGWFFDRANGRFASDRNDETATLAELRELAAPGAELTFTAVFAGSGRRIGIDRDADGFGNATERDLGTDPADAASHP
ncbi:MAG: hypothetical protein V3T86_16685 [Planctomycetota bacterium]